MEIVPNLRATKKDIRITTETDIEGKSNEYPAHRIHKRMFTYAKEDEKRALNGIIVEVSNGAHLRISDVADTEKLIGKTKLRTLITKTSIQWAGVLLLFTKNSAQLKTICEGVFTKRRVYERS